MSNDSQHHRLVQELLDIDREIMKAIGAKDAERLAPLLAEAFTLKTPGAPEMMRDAFLEAIAVLPGEILSIAGRESTPLVVGEVGIVSGVQVAQVRLADDGRIVTSQSVYTDVFERRDGQWRLRFAFSSELPAPSGDAAAPSGTP
jgi:ketosteroid isomerase-like protein